MTDAQALRHRLREAGYCGVIPLYGKEPPIYGKNNQKKGLRRWQTLHESTAEMIDMYSKTWPDATNTGVLTRHMPTLDVDILDAAAAKACEDCIRDRYEDAGYVLTRVGKAPKFAIPFRTEEPFEKITVNLIAPDGSEGQKIEFLGDGQQVVVAGTHPDIGQPYRTADSSRSNMRTCPISANKKHTPSSTTSLTYWFAANTATGAHQGARGRIPTAPRRMMVAAAVIAIGHTSSRTFSKGANCTIRSAPLPLRRSPPVLTPAR